MRIPTSSDGSNNLNENRLVSGSNQEDDHSLDNNLRPRTLDSYVGQDSIKSNLGIAITAAKQRGEPLDHILLYGPPGLGENYTGKHYFFRNGRTY